MNDVKLLLDVANAVEKSIDQGYTCNWGQGRVSILRLKKEGCPAMLYGLQNGLLEKEGLASYSDYDLLFKISKMTSGIGAFDYTKENREVIKSRLTKSTITDVMQTSEQIKQAAEFLAEGLMTYNNESL